MPVFARAIVAVIITGVTLSLALLSYVNFRSAQQAAQNELNTRNRVKANIDNFHRRFRRFDVCVGSQKISGKKEVLETTLIWQEYGFVDNSNQPVPRNVRSTVISGDKATVEAFSLQFRYDFTLPAELKQHSDLFADHTLKFFHRIYGTDPMAADCFITPQSKNPPPCLVLGQKPMELNRRLWQSIWGLIHSGTQAQKHGLYVTDYDPATFQVEPGIVYHVWAEDRSLRVIPEDSPAAVGTMLNAYEEDQKKKAELPPDDQ